MSLMLVKCLCAKCLLEQAIYFQSCCKTLQPVQVPIRTSHPVWFGCGLSDSNICFLQSFGRTPM